MSKVNCWDPVNIFTRIYHILLKLNYYDYTCIKAKTSLDEKSCVQAVTQVNTSTDQLVNRLTFNKIIAAYTSMWNSTS